MFIDTRVPPPFPDYTDLFTPLPRLSHFQILAHRRVLVIGLVLAMAAIACVTVLFCRTYPLDGFGQPETSIVYTAAAWLGLMAGVVCTNAERVCGRPFHRGSQLLTMAGLSTLALLIELTVTGCVLVFTSQHLNSAPVVGQWCQLVCGASVAAVAGFLAGTALAAVGRQPAGYYR